MSQTHGYNKRQQGNNRSKNSTDKSLGQAPTSFSKLPSIMRRAEMDPQSLSPNEVNQLQQTIGNQAVMRLVQHQPATGIFTIQRKFEGSLKSMSVEAIHEALLTVNDKVPPPWKIKRLMTDRDKTYTTLKEVADALSLKAPAEPALDTTTDVVGSTETDIDEPDIPEDAMILGKELGDGSHHAAYTIVGNEDQIFLYQKSGKAVESREQRLKAYASFPDATFVPAATDLPLTTAYLESKALQGYLMPKMKGDFFHSTRQSWGFGLKKTVDKWMEDKGTALAKINKLIEGIEEFFGFNMIVDDFQYWVEPNGEFKLTDVKSAMVAPPDKQQHADLYDALQKLKDIRDTKF